MARKKKNKQVEKFKRKHPFIYILIVLLIFATVFALIHFDVIQIPDMPSYGQNSTNSSGNSASSDPVGDAPAEYNVEFITSQELSIHFLELGNKYTGDCTLIKVGNTEVLIDAGSKTSSVSTIKQYVDQYCTDGILEYVIVTHAHEDHYAGFATSEKVDSIFDLYDCKNIITFSQVTSGKDTQAMYKNFTREVDDEVAKGAKLYKADEAANKTFSLGNNVELQILDSYYYYNVSSTENDHSVCCLINQKSTSGDKHYLFTGDLEKKGEEKLVEMNKLPEVDLYKAGHHGSKTSSNEALLSVVKPKMICVCCCAGSSEYTSDNANQFPTQDFINRVAPYTKKVYVTTLCVDYKEGVYTSMNGNIAICSVSGTIKAYFTSNDTLLKDTDWFKQNRTLPSAWA